MNRYLLTIICTLSLSWMTTALYSMECALVKPTIKGRIYIDHQEKSASYGSSSYHEKITACMGIPSQIQIPLIPVTVMVGDNENDIIDWQELIPHAIQEFESQQYEQEIGRKVSTEEDYSVINNRMANKKFVPILPITCFLNIRAGDVLRCNVHGYPTELVWCDNLWTQQSMTKDLIMRMDAFIARPMFFCPERELTLEEFTSHGLIKNGQHGPNSLVYYFRTLLHPVYSNATLLLSFVKSLEQ